MQHTFAITYPSALEFWLDGTNIDTERYIVGSRKLGNIPDAFVPPDLKTSAEELVLDLGLKRPVSFLSLANRNRNPHTNYKNYTKPKNLPKNSFIQMDTGLYPKLDRFNVFVASPEYCFWRAAMDYSLAQLVEIGNNLCAIYVCDKNCSFGQRKRTALVNKKTILDYVTKAKGAYGAKKAMVAAKYVLDNSYSPMESKLATIANLSKYCGGYGVPDPVLNYDIFYKDGARRFLKADKSCCDMVWPKQKIILEYDSDAAHGNAEQYAYDKKKYRALQMSGYKVFPIIKQDLRSLDFLDDLFFSIRKELGMRSDFDYFKKYLPQRRSVFVDLFREY